MTATTNIGRERDGRDGVSSQRSSADLETRVLLALEAANATLERPPAQLESHPDSDQARELLRGTVEALAERLRDGATRIPRERLRALSGALTELLELREVQRERRVAQRLDALDRVQDALQRLRRLDTVTDILQRACMEACRACGVDRALLFRVAGSEVVCEGAHFGSETEWAREVMRMARRNRPRLVHSLLETELLRRRAPALVSDAVNDPRTHKGLVAATKTTAYIAAPIMPEGRVIGFMHADCHFSGRVLDTLDRDTLQAFAQGLGHAVERATLLERLRAQRDEVRKMVRVAEVVMNELCTSDIELARSQQDSLGLANASAALFFGGESPVATRAAGVDGRGQATLESLLTRREREVLALMAEGARNGTIAERLVISEGTVKSHVKHILRKLQAANRAEAVSRYMRLAGGDGPA